jgi:hypothetical protein
MIGPEQRVFKPAGKSCRNVAAAMGKRWRGTGGPQHQHYCDDWNLPPPRSDRELFCKIAIRIHCGRCIKIAQQIDLVVARQFEHGLVKRDHERAIGLKI